MADEGISSCVKTKGGKTSQNHPQQQKLDIDEQPIPMNDTEAVKGRKSGDGRGRCDGCRLLSNLCICEHLRGAVLDLPTRVTLIVHHHEWHKTTSTGWLAAELLKNSNVFIHGSKRVGDGDGGDSSAQRYGQGGGGVLRGTGALADDLLEDEEMYQNILLFPDSDARVLSEDTLAAQGKEERQKPASAALEGGPSRSDKPFRLIVPDGNWGQARRLVRRLSALADVPRYVLPSGGKPTEWGVRSEPFQDGLATFEAIARALRIIENAGGREGVLVEEGLMKEFRLFVSRTIQMRGNHRPAIHATPEEAGAVAKEKGLDIVKRGNGWLVVSKPPGMFTESGWDSGGDNVSAGHLLSRMEGRRQHAVYPLDKGASGLVLFASTDGDAFASLQRAYQAGYIDTSFEGITSYVALGPKVDGWSADPSLRIAVSQLVHFKDAAIYSIRPCISARKSLPGGEEEEHSSSKMGFPSMRQIMKDLRLPLWGDSKHGRRDVNIRFRAHCSPFRPAGLALHLGSVSFPDASGDGGGDHVTVHDWTSSGWEECKVCLGLDSGMSVKVKEE